MANNQNAGNRGGPAYAGKPRGPPPALNPESCALVQPYKDFVGRGFLSKIAVEFTPLGNKVSCSLRSDLLKTGETENTLIAIGDAKQRIIEGKLWTPGKGGAKETKGENALPKKTLCKEDLVGKDDKMLSARISAVAKALGDTVARGRIGSLKYHIENVDTFEEWWGAASAAEKTRLLSDKKHHDTFSEADHLRISGCASKCPFLGSVLPPHKEEEETDEEEERPQPSKALVPKK